MKKYKYKISVIISIYNVEDYLEETIESVINQTLNFKKNIQMILVNDGSPDNSEEICLKYKKKYPENILYIKQKNSGVSAARNNGLKHAEGEYINFLDSDDKWEKSAFEKGYKMLENNSDINAVFFRMKFFEASTTYHALDHVYLSGDRIVNLADDYDCIKIQSCSILYRATALKGHQFNTNLKIAEDARFVTEVVFENLNVGIISSCNYLYRKRKNKTSAMQSSARKKTWYTDTIEFFHKYIIELSEQKYGKVIDYVQFMILYDLQWRLFRKVEVGVLSKEEETKYINDLQFILTKIDNKIIETSPFYTDLKRISVYSFKEERKVNLKYKNGKFSIEDINDFNIKNLTFDFNNLIIEGDKLHIYGAVLDFDKDMQIYIIDQNKKKHIMRKYELDKKNRNQIFIHPKYSNKKIGLHCEMDLKKIKKFYFAICIGGDIIKIDTSFSLQSRLNSKFSSSYLKSDNYYIKYNKRSNCIYIVNKNLKNKLKYELKIVYNLLIRKKIKILVVIALAKLYSIFNIKELWIVSDRLNIAGDNGEAFFDYLINNCKEPKHKYFVISKKSKDYLRLKSKYGNKLLVTSSLKYKILFLNSTKVISAHADDYVTNPFGKAKIYYNDMFKFKFVFLQHGITKDDLSPWLNINNKIIDLFCVSNKKERDSIYKFKYNYSKKVAKITGMARYDLLNNEKLEKTILLMPTWRKNLTTSLDKTNGFRKKDEQFKETEYFKFFNNLINDERLLRTLKEKGYKIKFVPHNNMLQQVDDFDYNEFVTFAKNVSYKDEFNKSALLVTDYSSVFFDFAYLNKPIIYCQFDKEDFFKAQVFDQGYYDYKKDGFGPVCETCEETVNAIINYLNKDCNIELKYSNRIEKFYEYNDYKNCERIYNEIINMK